MSLTLLSLLSGCDLQSSASDTASSIIIGGGGGYDAPSQDDEREQLPEEEPDEECVTEGHEVLWISPDDSNSMSSPVQLRTAAVSGTLDVTSVDVRVYEFMNYYDLGYEAPSGDELGLALELVPTGPGAYRLQLAVSAPEATERAPMNLVLVLDTSGSMAGASLDRLQDSVRAIAGELRVGDIVSMNSWSSSSSVILNAHPVSGPDDPTLLTLVDALTADGGTDLAGGLEVGYRLAEASFSEERINRVVLVSDGGANLGVTSSELIGDRAGDHDDHGIYLVGVGVGDAASYHDDLMDEVTDLGRGASVFVPDADEAERMFGERFCEVMDVAAREVEISLTLPSGFEIVRTTAEDVSTERVEIPPQHLAPGATMVVHHELEHCDPQELDPEAEVQLVVGWRDPWTLEERLVETSATISELVAAEPSASMLEAMVYLELADVVRARQTGGPLRIAELTRTLEQARAQSPSDPDLAEIELVLNALVEAGL